MAKRVAGSEMPIGAGSFQVGQEVVITQKTKEFGGTIIKLNPCKAQVEVID